MILLRKPVRMPQSSFLLYGSPFFSNTSYKVQIFAPSLSSQCYNLVSVRVPHVFYCLTLKHQLKGSWTCCYQITVLYMCMLMVLFQTVNTVGFSLYAIVYGMEVSGTSRSVCWQIETITFAKIKLGNVKHFWFIESPVLPDVTLMTIQWILL